MNSVCQSSHTHVFTETTTKEQPHALRLGTPRVVSASRIQNAAPRRAPLPPATTTYMHVVHTGQAAVECVCVWLVGQGGVHSATIICTYNRALTCHHLPPPTCRTPSSSPAIPTQKSNCTTACGLASQQSTVRSESVFLQSKIIARGERQVRRSGTGMCAAERWSFVDFFFFFTFLLPLFLLLLLRRCLLPKEK